MTHNRSITASLLSSRTLAGAALLGVLCLAGSASAQSAKYFNETFSQADVGPNLVDLQSAYTVVNGLAYRPQIIGHSYLATQETDYNEGDWRFTVDWHLAPWDMPHVGIGAASPSNYNWVVGTPDQSVYLHVNTHQPYGNPGQISIVVQSAGWDRTIIPIGAFVGGWGKYGIEIEKSGNAVTFSLSDPAGTLMGSGTIDDITVTAPWLNDQNSRLFVGSVRGPNYNAHTYWDNFEVQSVGPQKYFLETFSQSDVGPNLVDLQSGFTVDSGAAHRPAVIGHSYLATQRTDYNQDDWMFSVDWNLAPWDMPVVGIGAASPSNYNLVVGTPDQSVYLHVDTHQPYGNPGQISIVVQSAGWDRTIIPIGDFVGSWGTYSIEVEKSGNAVTFGLYDTTGALMGSGTIDDLTVTAPWLNDLNSRLFVGSIRGVNYNAHTYWDNFEIHP